MTRVRLTQHTLFGLYIAAASLIFLFLFTPRASKTYTPPPSTPAWSSESTIVNSIIVPTYHEALNIKPLVTQVFDAFPESQRPITEIIIVDDNSQDGTAEECETLKEGGYNLVLVVRSEGSGLSSAVLRGFEEAKGVNLLVMDADLQHPPTKVPSMFDALSDKTPFALGTRYGPGVEMDRDWPLYRRIISWGARVLARPLTSAGDPMSGFFALRKDIFRKSTPLNTAGFKLGLELLLKTPLPSKGIAEVPFDFAKRLVGESKLSGKVIFRYVGQLLALYWWRYGLRWPIFVASLSWCVGAGAWIVGKIVWEKRRRQRLRDRKLRLDA